MLETRLGLRTAARAHEAHIVSGARMVPKRLPDPRNNGDDRHRFFVSFVLVRVCWCSNRPNLRRLFYVAMSVACAVTVFVGFSKTFYLGSAFEAEPLSPLFVLHGVVLSGWIVLFFIQTVLVSMRRIRLHRQLGYIGVGLAVAMVVLGPVVSMTAVQGRLPLRGDSALPGLAHLFGDTFVFAVLVATAIGFRRHPEIHKRIMLLATVSILNPAIARWPLGAPPGPQFVYPV